MIPWASITERICIDLVYCNNFFFFFFFFRSTHPSLELDKIRRAESISLRHYRYKVDTCGQALHHLNIKGLQGVSGWSDEVQTGMHTHVDLLLAMWLLLLEHVRFVLVIEELNDWLPGITVVDIVSKTRGINDGQTD